MTTKVVDVDNYLFMRRFTATVASAVRVLDQMPNQRTTSGVTARHKVQGCRFALKHSVLRESYARREATMTANGERRQGTSTAKPARSRRRISSASGTYVSSSAHDS